MMSLSLTLLLLSPSVVLGQSCCPDNAWGELKADSEYVDRGTVDRIDDDLDIYRVGNSSKAVIWNYDIFGFDKGRTRQLADELAERGFLVLIPDYYRGSFNDPVKDAANTRDFIMKQSVFENLKKDWKRICPHAVKLGAKTFGLLGTCWGTYPVIKFSAFPEISAGVSMHPSHPQIMAGLGEDEKEAYEAVKHTKQLFMPAGKYTVAPL